MSRKPLGAREATAAQSRTPFTWLQNFTPEHLAEETQGGRSPGSRKEAPPSPEAELEAPAAPGAAHDGVGFSAFGENNLKTRLRSHPEVAARHYADLAG